MHARRALEILLTVTAMLIAAGGVGHAGAQSIDGLWELHIPQVRTPRNVIEGPFTEIVYLTLRDGNILGGFGPHAENLLNYSDSGHSILGTIGGHFARGVTLAGRKLSSRFIVAGRNFRDVTQKVKDQIDRLKKPAVFDGTLSADGQTIGGTFQWLWVTTRNDTLTGTTDVPVRATLRRIALTLRAVEHANNLWREIKRPEYGAPFAIELVSDKALSTSRIPVTLDFAFGTRRREYVLTAVDVSRSRFRSEPIVFRPPANYGDNASMAREGGRLLVTLPFYHYLRASLVAGNPGALSAIIAPLRNVVIMRTLLIAGAVVVLGGIAAGGLFTVRRLRRPRTPRLTLADERAAGEPPSGVPQVCFVPESDAGTQTIAQDIGGLTGPAIRLRPEWDAGIQTLAADVPVVLFVKGKADD